MEYVDKSTGDMPSRAEAEITTRIIHNSSGEGEGSPPLLSRRIPYRDPADPRSRFPGLTANLSEG
jgi:hypothetical protein